MLFRLSLLLVFSSFGGSLDCTNPLPDQCVPTPNDPWFECPIWKDNCFSNPWIDCQRKDNSCLCMKKQVMIVTCLNGCFNSPTHLGYCHCPKRQESCWDDSFNFILRRKCKVFEDDGECYCENYCTSIESPFI